MSGYKTEGYSGTGVGVISVPREAALNDSRAQTLRLQLAMEQDPEKRKALMMRIAVEDKYAKQAQAAQQVVQDSVVGDPEAREIEYRKRGGDRSIGSGIPSMIGGYTAGMQVDPIAKMRRQELMKKAMEERAKALGEPYELSALTFYGA